MVYPACKRDEVFQLSFFLVNQIAFNETKTLGDEKVWNS